MLSFEIKANLNIYILEIGQHCRSDRIKYHKTISEGRDVATQAKCV